MKQVTHPITVLYLSLISAFLSTEALGQTTIVSAEYAPPTITVAPGQVVTLYTLGLTVPTPLAATSLPLPTSLGGISVIFTGGSLPSPVSVPLFSIATDAMRTEFTDVTIQIPTEATATGSHESPSYGTLAISQNGVVGSSVTTLLAVSNLRIIPSCDSMSCSAGFWHNSGAAVTPQSPASPGENLTVYLTGLGVIYPIQPSGTAPTTPTAAQNMPTNVQTNLTYSFNPLPYLGAGLILSPTYVGVTPGAVGLYQINFELPAAVPAGVPSCNASNPTGNVNITISAQATQFTTAYDGGSLCVNF